MKRLLTGILPLAIAAALVSGCAGPSRSARTLPPTGATKKPDALASFTVRYPTNLVRAQASGGRTPRFVDPYGSPILEVYTSTSYGYGTSDICIAVHPGADGTQTITIPVFSDGGAVRIREYQSGSVGSDGISCGSLDGSMLAQTWTPNPGYYLNNTQIPYQPFTPGTNVYGFAPPTPTPTPTPSASPSASPSPSPSPTATPQQIFTAPLTLQPVVSQIIYNDQAAGSSYTAVPFGNAIPLTAHCGTDTLTFLAADANGVALGANTLPAPTPAPSGSPSPTPVPTPIAYSGFLPVTFSNVSASSFTSLMPGPNPGTMTYSTSFSGPGSAGFTVTANDVFGASYSYSVTISASCLG